MVTVIAKSSERIKNLSMHLIDAIKLREGTQVIDPHKQNLTELIHDFIDEAHVLYVKEKNISILFNENRDIFVKADYEAIGQVMRNIVINAIKFSPAGSFITITIDDLSSKVKVTIRDQGVGIAEEDLSNIFNQFYQSSRTKTGAGGGMGLGLSISKYIIEAHGGEIWAQNNEGKGCSLSFTLNSLAHTDSNEANLQNNKKILMIDDDELITSSLKLGLGTYGFDVVAVSNGPEGIQIMENGRMFDFVLLDIMMPGMNGFEVLKLLKDKWPDIKVVVHSGVTNPSEVNIIKKLGACSFLKKPYRLQDLISHFYSVVENSEIV